MSPVDLPVESNEGSAKTDELAISIQAHSPDYRAALANAAFYRQTEVSFLRIAGPDRLAFLQRQSSNDLNLLAAERSLVTVLTSPTARILDVFTLISEPESILAFSLPGIGAATTRFLRSRIFFMDKVTVSEASPKFVLIELIGPQAGSMLAQLGLLKIPSGDEVVSFKWSGVEMRVLGQRELGLRLIVPTDAADILEATLSGGGATWLTLQSYEILRIEAGLPTAERELVAEYTPLETGLEWAVAEGKGCYTGQEVIARQRTYDKVTRGLVGLRLKGDAIPGDPIWSADDGKPAGTLTSAAQSPRFGSIALAIVKRPYNRPGTAVVVGEKGVGVRAKVTSLPFQKERDFPPIG
jgi:folate-binding protein YgfZ